MVVLELVHACELIFRSPVSGQSPFLLGGLQHLQHLPVAVAVVQGAVLLLLEPPLLGGPGLQGSEASTNECNE